MSVLVGTLGCDLAQPQVVVVNRLGPHVLVRQASFGGCLWPSPLKEGEASSVGNCVPGSDRVRFQKLDVAQYCRTQVDDGAGIDGLCACEGEPPDEVLVDAGPLWFNYQTVALHQVDYGDVLVIELWPEAIEQDFDAPGPYGH